MKKKYIKPNINDFQVLFPHLLIVGSGEHRGWAINGEFNEDVDPEPYDQDDATYNLWQQELDDDDTWADLD